MFQVPGSGVEVQVLDDHRDEEVWLRVTTEGFAVPDSSSTSEAPTPEVLDTISRIMRTFVHKDIVRYLVRIDGEPAAAASSTITGGVLGIFGTATVPAYRGRGAQSAIVSRAVQNAAGVADLAIATVEPGSISQRTFERCGFQVLYTRAILVRH
jgi:GNAT superfamily N-acetyltransferase